MTSGSTEEAKSARDTKEKNCRGDEFHHLHCQKAKVASLKFEVSRGALRCQFSVILPLMVGRQT